MHPRDPQSESVYEVFQMKDEDGELYYFVSRLSNIQRYQEKES